MNAEPVPGSGDEAAGSVRALQPEGRARHALVRAGEWVRERFWALPSLLLLGGSVWPC